jgi:hypothetical protein
LWIVNAAPEQGKVICFRAARNYQVLEEILTTKKIALSAKMSKKLCLPLVMMDLS